MKGKNENLNRVLGVVQEINLNYNSPINLPQFVKALGKTNQTESLLRIQNLSNIFDLALYIQPMPKGQNPLVKITANDRKPIYITNNWNGAILSVANISQEAATGEITLVATE
tara:strand:+ start:23455 stop:23793 length:339 start_codon:yes stop_codon:yes gene_type:complete